MRTVYYTTREFNALTAEQKLSFGAGNVRQVTVNRNGRTVHEWAVTIVD